VIGQLAHLVFPEHRVPLVSRLAGQSLGAATAGARDIGRSAAAAVPGSMGPLAGMRNASPGRPENLEPWEPNPGGMV